MLAGNSPAFDRHVFVRSQNRWSLGFFDAMLMISEQIRWQDP